MTTLVTLDEAKKRLSYEYEDKDGEIQAMVEAIESYLFFATGVDWSESDNEKAKALAKEYILLKLHLDYYSAHTEIDDLRLTNAIKQLQVIGAAV